MSGINQTAEVIVCCTIYLQKFVLAKLRTPITSSSGSMPKYLLTFEYVSFDMAPNVLTSCNILFMMNCSDCLSAEFIGHTSVLYNKTRKHFDFNENRTSSDALRPIFPKML